MQRIVQVLTLTVIFAFLSFGAKGQYFQKKHQQTDSLWTAIQTFEDTYTANIKQKTYRVSTKGKRLRVKGYNEAGLLIYKEKTKYFKSGIARRKVAGFSTFSSPEILNSKGSVNLKRFKHQTFELKSYGDAISYAIARNTLNQVVLRVLNNKPLILP